MTKRAVGYTRVSTVHQAEEGQSLANQEHEIKRRAEYEKWDLRDVYSDRGVSGKNTKHRPGLQTLLRMAQNREYDVLVVHSLSRLGRNVRDLLNIVEHLSQFDVEIVFVKENIDTKEAIGKLLLQVLGAVYEFEREAIVSRSKDVMMRMAREGTPVTGAPPLARYWDEESETFRLIPEEGVPEKGIEPTPLVRMLRWAADQYIQGNGSLRSLAKQINTAGVPMSPDTLRDAFLTRGGDTWQMKMGGETFVFVMEPLFSSTTLKQLKHRTEMNRTSKNLDERRRYLLTGYTYCAHCGGRANGQTVTRVSKKDKHLHKYYKHSDRQCEHRFYIPAELLESVVFRTIFENVSDPEEFGESLRAELPSAEEIAELQSELAKWESDIAKLDQQMETLLDEILDPDITVPKKMINARSDKITRAKKQAEVQRDQVQQELDRLPDPAEVEMEAEQMRLMYLDHFGSPERLANLTDDEKAKILAHVFPEGTDPETERTYGIHVISTESPPGLPLQGMEVFLQARYWAGQADVNRASEQKWIRWMDELRGEENHFTSDGETSVYPTLVKRFVGCTPKVTITRKYRHFEVIYRRRNGKPRLIPDAIAPKPDPDYARKRKAKALVHAGKSYREVAKSMKVGQTTVWRWINGRR